MSTMVVTTRITHKYLMGKTKFWLAHDYLDLLDELDKTRQGLEQAQAEIERLREALGEIRDLARTGLKLDCYPTETDWALHKVNRIAGMADRALTKGREG